VSEGGRGGERERERAGKWGGGGGRERERERQTDRDAETETETEREERKKKRERERESCPAVSDINYMIERGNPPRYHLRMEYSNWPLSYRRNLYVSKKIHKRDLLTLCPHMKIDVYILATVISKKSTKETHKRDLLTLCPHMKIGGCARA